MKSWERRVERGVMVRGEGEEKGGGLLVELLAELLGWFVILACTFSPLTSLSPTF